MHCFHENWVIKNAFSLKKGRIGLEKPETLVLIVTSSVIDKKLEIYKNLEIDTKTFSEIDRNFRVFFVNFEFIFEVFLSISSLFSGFL